MVDKNKVDIVTIGTLIGLTIAGFLTGQCVTSNKQEKSLESQINQLSAVVAKKDVQIKSMIDELALKDMNLNSITESLDAANENLANVKDELSAAETNLDAGVQKAADAIAPTPDVIPVVEPPQAQ